MHSEDTAKALLHKNVMDAVGKLRVLGQEPIFIVGYPHKFNDAGDDDYWCAVQISHDYWEASHFYRFEDTYRGPHMPGDRGFARIDERSSYAFIPSAESEEAAQEISSSAKLIEARAILAELENSDWRKLAEKCIGANMRFGLGIYIHRKSVWIVESLYNGGLEGKLWHCNEDGNFVYFGICDQLDYRIGFVPPLLIDDIYLSHSELLTGPAKNWFLPNSPSNNDDDRQHACNKLLDLISGFKTNINSLTSQPVSISSRVTPLEFHPESPDIIVNGNDFYLDQNTQQWEFRENHRRAHEHIFETNEILQLVKEIWNLMIRLEDNKWRELFDTAYFVKSEDYDLFQIFVHSNKVCIRREFTVLDLEDGTFSEPYLMGNSELEQIFYQINSTDNSAFQNAISSLLDWVKKPE